MTFALTLVFIGLLLAFLALCSISPRQPVHSEFERSRRQKAGEDMATDEHRDHHLTDIQSLLRMARYFVLVLLTLTSVGLFGWIFGVIVMVIIILSFGRIVRLGIIRRYANTLYDEQEGRILAFIRQYENIFRLVRHDTQVVSRQGFESKHELEHLIATSENVLTAEERKLLLGGLMFNGYMARDVMTPRRDIFSVKKTEILGPLVLDDLHKSGHDSFPVTNGQGIDDVVGILRLRDVQTLDTTRKHTAKVETAMDPDVRFINVDESLSVALRILLDAQHHLLIVVDDERHVAGLLTLSDIIKTLFGRK